MSQFQPPPIHPQQFVGMSPPTTTTSGPAIASLICSIFGFCTFGLTGIVGIVLGIIGVTSVNASGGKKTGLGLAIAGIVVGCASVLMSCLLAAIVLPAIGAARDGARIAIQTANLANLSDTVYVYSNQNDDQLPPANDWVNALEDVVDVRSRIKRWASAPGSDSNTRGIAMNDQLDGIAISDIASPYSTVLFFECKPNSPLAGGPELLPNVPMNGRAFVVVYVSGEVRYIQPEEVAMLRWSPAATTDASD